MPIINYNYYIKWTAYACIYRSLDVVNWVTTFDALYKTSYKYDTRPSGACGLD